MNPTTTQVTTAREAGAVALTFDDGPNPGETDAVLDLLAEHDLPAVFCVIGQNIQGARGAELLRRIVAEGHTLCNHTTSYADMGAWTPEQVEADLTANLAIIREALGDPEAPVPYFRAPNGSWGQTAEVAARLGMQPLGLGNTIADWETQDVATLTANLRAAMQPGAVVLTHDGGGDRTGTVEALRTVVAEKVAAGWTFSLPAERGPGGGGGSGTTVLSSDFEEGLAPWTARGDGTAPSATVTTEAAHGGSQAALVTGRGQTWHGLGVDVTSLFTAGTTYHVSAWVTLADGTTPDPADLRISVQRDVDGSSSYDTVGTATGVTAGTWTQISADYVMSAADSALLYLESASGTSSFLVDDVVVTRDSAPPVQTDIPSLQDALPWPVGVAIDERETVGQGAVLVTKHFDQITAENAMKPESIQPTEGEFTFAQADALVDFAVAHGQRVYGHTLVWHSQTPDWFFLDEAGQPLTSSAADQAVLRDRMKTHIDTVADHLRARYGEFGTPGNPVVAFDVVNEAIAESETDGLRRSRWYEVLGEQYLDLAFAYASEAFNGGVTENPPVTLFLNDYNTELPAKRAAMADVAARLLARDVPVGGLGHQFHVSLVQPVAQLRTSIERFAELGLVQAVTELDVQIDGTVTHERLVQQGYYYADVFDMLREFPDLFAVTVWGPYDSRSWRSGAPLVFDDQLQAKPAYWGVVDRDELPALTRQADVHASDVTVDASAVDAREWDLLPLVEVGSDGTATTGFQLRWAADHLTAYVEVADATDDGAADTADLFVGGAAVTVARDGSGTGAAGTAVVRSTATGYTAVVRLPAADLAEDTTVPFDLRVTDGTTAGKLSWNDLSHRQEDGARRGVLTLVEPVGLVEIPQAAVAPVIDGVVDAVWASASTVQPGTLVEGEAGATADVSLLWREGTLYALFQVTDDELDSTSTNAWEQDSVEVFLDPVNAKAGAYRPADGQYRISHANAVSISGDLDVVGDNLTSATAVTATGYLVEAALTLESPVEAGAFVGLDVQVNDAAAGVRTGVTTWSDPTGRSYQSTARWGVGQLLAPAPVAVPTLTLDRRTVPAGGTVTAQVSGFTPGSTVALTLGRPGWTKHPAQPKPLTRVTVGADGSASVVVQIPARTKPGAVTLVATSGDLRAQERLTVTPAPSCHQHGKGKPDCGPGHHR